MIKAAIQIFLVLVIGLTAYNYFLGTEEEKAQAKETIDKVKEVGKAGVDLIKAEKEKFDAGKYDGALDKIGNLVDKLKSKAQDSKEMLDKHLYSTMDETNVMAAECQSRLTKESDINDFIAFGLSKRQKQMLTSLFGYQFWKYWKDWPLM